MAKKERPPPDDPEQSARFVETAKAVGADSARSFAKAVGAIVPKKNRKRRRKL
jgi:hypothetical protein